MAAEFERLAYEAALRRLDKQEDLIDELRARTGVLLAAAPLAASFLGQQAFRDPDPTGLAVAALAAFAVSFTASVFVLLPKRNLVFATQAASIANEAIIERLARVYTVAAVALIVETLFLVAMVGGIVV